MSKFKVGDKVRVRSDLIGKMYFMEDNVSDCLFVDGMERHSGKVVTIAGVDAKRYYIKEDDCMFHWVDEMFVSVEAEQPRREFIVIRRSGAETIAELRHDREVIRSGKAICNASDAFDFSTGAKLAFDRLMGREEPKPEPQPAHRFKVGDRVMHEEYGLGTIIGFVNYHPDVPYKVRPDDVRCVVDCWAENRVSPAPDPEPPKFYTGKVKMLRSCGCYECDQLVGKTFFIENGRGTIMGFWGQPFTSFADFVSKRHNKEWIEVED